MTENNLKREKRVYSITIIGSISDMLLVALKFAAGIIGHSNAMIAEAVHSLSDFITDVIVLIFVKLSNKPQDKNHDYGHGKFETLATAIVGILLFAVGVMIAYKNIINIYEWFHGIHHPSPGIIAFYMAVVSIIIKEILYRTTNKVGVECNSQVALANALHHRSDAFTSIGTLVGIGGAILLGNRWGILDPLAAVVVSIYIIKISVKLLVPSMGELLDESLPDSVEQDIRRIACESDGVADPHNMRTRRVGSHYAIELHIRMDGRIALQNAHHTATEIENRIKAKYGEGTYVTIHVEPLDEEDGNE